MRTCRRFGCVASIGLVSFCAFPSYAQIVAVDPTYNPVAGYTGPFSADRTYGWKFTVGNSPIEVSGLGFFDFGADGLADSHQVGIWSTDGASIVQATVPSGTAGSLVGNYRFTLATPQTLNANTEYYIGAFFPSANDPAIFGAPAPTFASEISFGTSSYSDDPGFAPPGHSYSANYGVFGANFQFSAVPEPHEYALMTGIGLAGFFFIRKRLGQS